jgi:hypothetical protein
MVISSIQKRFAVGVVLGAMSLPAFAADKGASATQVCGVCADPTWGEMRDPAPALVLESQADTEVAVASSDPTLPEARAAAPAIFDAPRSAGLPPTILSDPTLPTMATAAPAIPIKTHEPATHLAVPAQRTRDSMSSHDRDHQATVGAR